MEARERLRLFCALRLPDDVVDNVVRWQGEHLSPREQDLAATGRVVPRENLHLTLAFLGSTPSEVVPEIVEALHGAAAAAAPLGFAVSGYRETRSVGMLVFDDEGGAGAALARDLHGRLAHLGVYEHEKRPWLPHLTAVRFREKPRLRPDLPDLGRVVPSDAALYNSLLRSTGAQYVALATLALGGS